MGRERPRQHPGRLLRHHAGPHPACGRRGSRPETPPAGGAAQGHAPGGPGALRARLMKSPDWYDAWCEEAFDAFTAKQKRLSEAYGLASWERYDYDAAA